MEDLKVAILQTSLDWEKKDFNFSRIESKLEGLNEQLDLIVLPEMFNTGFTMQSAKFAEKMNGETIGKMQSWARAKEACVVGSFIVEDAGKYFNRLVWMQPNGSFLHYDKRHLFRMAGEHNYYSSGSDKLIVELKGWRICPLICYDLRFPVWSRNQNDYDCLVYIANWPERRRDPWSTLLKARAIENISYVIGVNRIGEDGNGISHSGDSAVIDFQGNIFSKTKPFEESVEVITLNGASLNNFREMFPAWKDADDFSIKI